MAQADQAVRATGKQAQLEAIGRAVERLERAQALLLRGGRLAARQAALEAVSAIDEAEAHGRAPGEHPALLRLTVGGSRPQS